MTVVFYAAQVWLEKKIIDSSRESVRKIGQRKKMIEYL